MKDTKDKGKKTLLISAALIAAGSAALICMKGSHNTANAHTKQASPQGAVETMAGAACVLDSPSVFPDPGQYGTTAGAAAVLELDGNPAPDAQESAVDTDDAAARTDPGENEYANLAIAKVDNYVNVRSAPDTASEITGKMYNGSVAQILSKAGENEEWFQVVSGTVEGYIKAEYFISGDDAAAVAHKYVTQYAVIQADRLNVRKEPDIASQRIGYIDNGERVKLVEWGDDWSKVDYAEGRQGYVSSEYVTIAEEFIYAKSIAEEQAELAALMERQTRTQTPEAEAPERRVVSVPPPQTSYETVSELRTAIVDYAMQYLGNRYVHGGQSLATGTDCSGFTCYVYKEFGYSLSRTPQGQYTSAGKSIDMSQIQPGDIICYSSNGSTCTHVALYIGDGKVIHAANSRKGVIISSYNYDGVILSVRSVVD